MAFDTVRTNKLRSALTVLGVVIGITSIVAMTSLIRGFDQSLRSSINSSARTRSSFRAQLLELRERRRDSKTLMNWPNPTISDSRAIEEQATLIQTVDVELGAAARGRSRPASSTGIKEQSRSSSSATARYSRRARNIPFLGGRFFNGTGSAVPQERGRPGQHAYKLLFGATGIDPIGKMVRVGSGTLRSRRRVRQTRRAADSDRARRFRRHSVHRLPANFRLRAVRVFAESDASRRLLRCRSRRRRVRA